MILELPWPPSINHAWKHRVIGRRASVYLSQAGVDFRREVVESIPAPKSALKTRLNVKIELFPPDLRRRDIDNHVKASLDALTHAGIWEDDEQIDQLQVIRKEKVKGGKMIVEITEL